MELKIESTEGAGTGFPKRTREGRLFMALFIYTSRTSRYPHFHVDAVDRAGIGSSMGGLPYLPLAGVPDGSGFLRGPTIRGRAVWGSTGPRTHLGLSCQHPLQSAACRAVGGLARQAM